LLGGCGADTNFNQIWGGEDDGGDGKLLRAKMHYDRGEYGDAMKLAQDLVATNPDNEEAAVVLGFTYLSSGGMDPFRLACKMVTISNGDECPRHPAISATSTSTKTSTGTATRASVAIMPFTTVGKLDSDEAAVELLTQRSGSGGSTTAGSTSGESASSSATETLKKLATELLSISDAEYETLSAESYNKGLFAASPILKPERVTETLRAGVNILNKMNLALKSVCRFVDTSSLAEHQNAAKTGRYDTGCTQTKQTRNNASKAHFLWGFAHLTEAMVYQSVLLYSTASSTTSNFEAAVNGLNGKSYSDAAGLSAFVSDVTELKDMIDAVFDTTDGSMLSETLKDLRTVSLAFTALGLPEDFSAPITQAIDKLDEVANKITQTSDPAAKNTQALKTQITENFAKTIGTKVGAVFDKKIGETLDKLPAEQQTEYKDKLTATGIGELSAEEKTTIFGSEAEADTLQKSLTDTCAAYDKIAADLPPEQAATSKPSACS
jgi:hypothetical protein